MSGRTVFRPKAVDINRSLAIVRDVAELDRPDPGLDTTAPGEAGEPGTNHLDPFVSDPIVSILCLFPSIYLKGSRVKFDLHANLAIPWQNPSDLMLCPQDPPILVAPEKKHKKPKPKEIPVLEYKTVSLVILIPMGVHNLG